MKYFSLFILSVFYLTASTQNIAAFSDYQKNFYVFDDGNIRQLEFQPVLSYKTGDKCIGYETNGNHFKVYNNHIDYDLSSMVKSYKVTDNLVTYQVGTQLYVFENGNKRLLSKFVGNYLAGDSLVAFFDTELYFFQVYYNGNIITLEDGLLFENTSLFKIGSNILGYIDAFQNFKVFYRGEVIELLQTKSVEGELGRNIMAYIDPITDFLQVFYKGEVIELETFRPVSYQVGYEKVAYVTDMDDFKLFDNGEVYTISSYKPEAYLLKDEMVVYEQQNQLRAFYNGEDYLVENYIPTSYKIHGSIIAYLDQNGYLNIFVNGEQKTLSYEQINDYKVLRKLVIFNEGMNTTKVYYNGQIYTK